MTPTPRPVLELVEECACGAKIRFTDDHVTVGYATLVIELRKWRREHRHSTSPSENNGASAIGFRLPEPNEGYTIGETQEQPYDKRIGFEQYRKA